MQFDTAILGKVIRTIRKKRRLSQEALSGLAGIARTHLTMIEGGTKQANLDTLYRIAQALDMRLSDLIRLAEDECSAPDSSH